jgi:hypothetical protein
MSDVAYEGIDYSDRVPTAKSEQAHEWTLLYDHFGPYGDQSEHFHACFNCDAILVGSGRRCLGTSAPHEVRE